MARHTISGKNGVRVRTLLPRKGSKGDPRTFVSAGPWASRTGNPWRDLPPRFGRWNAAWRRFRRWAQVGVWDRVRAAVRGPDTSTVDPDSTVIRAHSCAAGVRTKAGPQALGRRRGGFGTKAHARASPRGPPLVIRLTPGPAGDAPQAPARRAGPRRGRVAAVIADRGYDRGAVVRRVRGLRARVVIPPVRRRKHPRRYRRRRYETRNRGERFWNEVKPYRRAATRYEKRDVCSLALIHLASVMTVLRHP